MDLEKGFNRVPRDWFYLLGFYLSGTCSPGWSQTNSRRAVKWLCVYVCVPREVIRWAMHNLGVEEWLVSAVTDMYTGAKTVVRTVYGNREYFGIKVSMR